ncbi:ketopantoate reductase family protein [Egibacter rhizosphaerae]|nr:2-dehydropantoate 2-reductase [Egibacter rhizosphaerae]
MRIESVCVIGSGAIGSLCAGHLAQLADVSVLTRRENQAAALTEQGLRVSGKTERHVPIRASHRAADLPAADLVIVACKVTQLREAIAAFEGRAPDATVLTLQNGMGAEEVVGEHGSWPIVSGVTFMSGVRHSDVHVEYELDTATWMGPYHGTGTSYEVAAAIGELFVAGGLRAEVFADLRPAQWSKLLFNTAVNCVAAVTDLPHVGVFARRERDTDLGHLLSDLVAEGKAVAEAAGVELYEDPWEMNVRAVSVGQTGNEAYAHVPSMLADVRAGQATEVDFIAGSLVREADRHGVPVPLTRALYRLVKARDRTYDD